MIQSGIEPATFRLVEAMTICFVILQNYYFFFSEFLFDTEFQALLTHTRKCAVTPTCYRRTAPSSRMLIQATPLPTQQQAALDSEHPEEAPSFTAPIRGLPRGSRGKVALRAGSCIAKRSSRASRMSKTGHTPRQLSRTRTSKDFWLTYITADDLDRIICKLLYCVTGFYYATLNMGAACFFETVVPV
jgi:hypothetical protein